MVSQSRTPGVEFTVIFKIQKNAHHRRINREPLSITQLHEELCIVMGM